MLVPRFVVGWIMISMMVWSGGTVYAQTYPNKPIRIVTSGLGGGSDFTARLISLGLAGSWGQQVVVDNRSSGVIPGQIVTQAAADGYTLLVTGNTFWIGPFLQKVPYNVEKDFAPVIETNTQPNFIVVHPSLPVKSVKELITLAKAKPGELNYAAGSAGGATHLAGELFKAMAGVNIVRVPYKSNSQGMTDLIGGQVQLTFGPAVSVMPQVKAGKLRALAIASARPSALMPDVPTAAASGLPGYVAEVINGVFAPAKTPASTINRLNQEIVRVLNRADVREKLLSIGSEVVAGSPAEFAATVKSDMARMGKVIKDAGIQGE